MQDSVEGGFDRQSLYIEGDNLDVLKLLPGSYLDSVKSNISIRLIIREMILFMRMIFSDPERENM